MVITLKSGAIKAEIAAIEKAIFRKRTTGFNAEKYNGILKLKGDALEIQKELRKEWEGSFKNNSDTI